MTKPKNLRATPEIIETIAAKLAAADLDSLPTDDAMRRFSEICGDVIFTRDEMLQLVNRAGGITRLCSLVLS
jgi:hypothetical protein